MGFFPQWTYRKPSDSLEVPPLVLVRRGPLATKELAGREGTRRYPVYASGRICVPDRHKYVEYEKWT
jgi:hypothetical protein